MNPVGQHSLAAAGFALQQNGTFTARHPPGQFLQPANDAAVPEEWIHRFPPRVGGQRWQARTRSSVRQHSQQCPMQQRQVHWFGKKLCAICQAASSRCGETLAEQRDDWEAGMRILDALQQRPSIPIGGREVEDHRIGVEFLDLRVSVWQAGGLGYQQAVRHEEAADFRAQDRIVGDDENSVFAQALTCGHKKVLEGLDSFAGAQLKSGAANLPVAVAEGDVVSAQRRLGDLLLLMLSQTGHYSSDARHVRMFIGLPLLLGPLFLMLVSITRSWSYIKG